MVKLCYLYQHKRQLKIKLIGEVIYFQFDKKTFRFPPQWSLLSTGISSS